MESSENHQSLSAKVCNVFSTISVCLSIWNNRIDRSSCCCSITVHPIHCVADNQGDEPGRIVRARTRSANEMNKTSRPRTPSTIRLATKIPHSSEMDMPRRWERRNGSCLPRPTASGPIRSMPNGSKWKPCGNGGFQSACQDGARASTGQSVCIRAARACVRTCRFSISFESDL